MIVHVVLPLPLETTFSYLVPEALENDAQVGRRVVVEFGKRRLTGIISEQVADADTHEEASRLKPVLDVLDTTRAISDELLQLTRWIAHYYVCGWGEVLKTALPSGIDRQERVRRIRSCMAGASSPSLLALASAVITAFCFGPRTCSVRSLALPAFRNAGTNRTTSSCFTPTLAFWIVRTEVTR